MNLVTEIIVAVLTAYLALTNQIADTIISIIEPKVEEVEIDTQQESEPGLITLPTKIKSKGLPDILLRSAAYQRASALSSLDDRGVFVTDPTMALVNIFCTFTSPTTIRTTTGSGFFVHSDGVILTNAHVAQYLLLGSTNILGEAECIVRQGNPAVAKYKAELLYVPPTWIQENASLINAATPTGTGERDYALLYITNSIDGETLPETFPALNVDSDLLPRSSAGSSVTAAGYPATALLRQGPSTDLLAVASATQISELYTFGSNYADVFSIRGSAVGAEGSSGGPVVNKNVSAIGMIVTRGDDTIDGTGSLRAITTSYIHRTIQEETGFSLARNVSGDIESRAKIFTDTVVPFMIDLLSREINN